MTAPRLAVPRPRGEERDYFERAHARELVFQTCRSCGNRQWYPRVLCTRCHGSELELTDASGRGTVHSFTTVLRAGRPDRADDVPYTIVLVDLEEGPRVLAELVDVEADAGEPVVGAPVRADFVALTDELGAPVFRLVAGEAE